MNLDALVAPLRADVVSGAAVVARAAAAAMRRGAIHLPADSPEALGAALDQLALRVMEAQPAMAPLVELVTSVLAAAAKADSVESARGAAAAAAEAFRGRLEERGTQVAHRLAKAAPRGATLLTLSSSSTVRTGLLEAQPAMAPLVELVTSVLGATAKADSVESARGAAAAAAEAFRGRLEERGTQVAHRLAKAAPRGATLLTLSSSSTVRTGLLEAQPRGIRVVVLEGRPMCEGHALARTLAQAGIPVTLAVDAAGPTLVESADVVVMGADSVGDAGVVNKIGSLALAREAKLRDVPVWVAADRSKWLPPGFPQPVDDDRPGEEIWRGARGVTVWNRYFEVLPSELVDKVITDAGSFSPAELDAEREKLEVAPVLERWARGS